MVCKGAAACCLSDLLRAAGEPQAAAAANAGQCGVYTLVRANATCEQRFGAHIWVKRSMLRDHFLTETMQALLVLQAQLAEQAAALAG